MVRLSLLALSAALAFDPSLASTQETGTVVGRVIDAEARTPIVGVVVGAAVGAGSALSDERGLFRITGLRAGENELVFQHLSYGTHRETVTVLAAVETSILVELSTEAIELAPVVVETTTELEERRITTGSSINEVGSARIEEAVRSGLDIGQLIQSSLPGVDVRYGTGAGVCVTYRAIRSDNDRGCNGLSVRLDGVPVADPAYIYRSMPLSDIERIEVLSPGQAGVRYGMRGGQGVLLIETKRAEAARRTDVSRYLTGFGWEGETQSYAWAKVFGGAFAANAIGVALSLSLADRCFYTPEDNPLALRTDCGPAATASSSILSVVVPALGAGLVARWAGATDRSRGRLVPSMVAAGIVLTGGYLMVIGGEGSRRTAGGVVLAVGVPLTMTVTDRVLRIRR